MILSLSVIHTEIKHLVGGIICWIFSLINHRTIIEKVHPDYWIKWSRLQKTCKNSIFSSQFQIRLGVCLLRDNICQPNSSWYRRTLVSCHWLDYHKGLWLWSWSDYFSNMFPIIPYSMYVQRNAEAQTLVLKF